MQLQNRWIVILAIIVSIILILIGYMLDWTGFGEYIGPVVQPYQTFQRAKTLWDWMQLLIIPVILVGGAYLLNESARKREKAAEEQIRQREKAAEEQIRQREGEIAGKRAETERNIASDNRQEAALQTYLDRMAELLIKEKLRESKNGSEVRAVARARTLTVLERLGKDRKGALLRFLYEAKLINKEDEIVINLDKADLIEADLIGANLSNAILSNAILSYADLSNANLSNANLSYADLSKADLSNANLSGGANLSKADLSNANLSEAILSGANLSEAYLIRTDLSGGADLTNTDLNGAHLIEADMRGAYLGRGRP